MLLLQALPLSVALIASLLTGAFSFYNEANTCSFTQIDKSTCIGPGTTEVADLAKFYLGSGESYVVSWYPCGLMFLAKISMLGATSLTQKMRINGIYAYINKVDGAFYYFPTIGCTKPIVLCEKDEYLPGLDDLTIGEVYKIVVHLTNGYPYETSCNIFSFKYLVGPNPNTPEDPPGSNMYVDFSSIESAHIVSYNGTGEALAKYFSCISKHGISITPDKNNVILSQARSPVVGKCKRKKFDLVDPTKGKYPEISSLKPNSACFWATVVGQQLTTLIVYRLIYVYWGIMKNDGSGVFYIEGYIPAMSLDYTFDPLYYSYC